MRFFPCKRGNCRRCGAGTAVDDQRPGFHPRGAGTARGPQLIREAETAARPHLGR